ncbi:MAG: glycoside hydrolase family 57 protein [Candidatus Micrarchaeota archaeon]
MPAICLYFHVHQPTRLRKFSIFSHKPPSLRERYFDDGLNSHYFVKAAQKCYLPTNALLLRLIEENGKRFRISYSITGTFLEQARRYSPETLDSFRRLASTGCVEFLDETYYHSLASIYEDSWEFERQVRAHTELIRDEFRQTPKVFRNTELLYSNRIAEAVSGMGFKGMLTEGIEWVLGWRSPNYVYRARFSPRLKVLLRNYKLSDDVGYRFGARWWPGWPLTADKYANWLAACDGPTANIFMDYETFGEHHWEGTGIHEFLRHLPGEALKHGNLSFATVGEVLEGNEAVGEIDVPSVLSWADLERDASAWLGNPIQQACFGELEALSKEIRGVPDGELQDAYGLLQTSDHLYYLCTKNWADGDVHKHFSPYKDKGPYDNFINYMNVLRDFRSLVQERAGEASRQRAAHGAGVRMQALKEKVELFEKGVGVP